MPVKVTFVVTIPKGNYLDGVYQAWLGGLRQTLKGKVAGLLEQEFKRRTQGWKHNVSFTTKFVNKTTQMYIDVGPDGPNKDIWVFVSGGTKPHWIKPVRAPSLLIKKGYHSRTDVDDVFGRPAYYAGSIFRMPKGVGVGHPGVVGREFERHIVDKNEEKIARMLYAASDAVLKRWAR